MRRFTAVLVPERETGSYSASAPALPGCFSQGRTIEQALDHAAEAIAIHLDASGADGEPAPADATPLVYMVDIDRVESIRRSRPAAHTSERPTT
jgi:antitoxin HicB